MKRKEVSVYDYLSSDEADELVRALKVSKISSIRHAIGSGENQEIYQVLIDHSDIKRATSVVDGFRVKLKKQTIELSKTCSKCKSKPPITHKKNNMSWWSKLLSIGTTVIECDNCGKVWYI